MKTIIRIARKEFAGFFSSPAAVIFLGTFLAVTLFVFFWVERFFARNIADVRPLFEWMPVLLIFLSAAITMRMWSEERRAGTLEMLLTAPVPPWKLVAGKFAACLGLVGTALALTLPLPVTVSFIGPLDWGPVLGGYLATVVMAGAYIAMGLFASAGSSNQIVSLIGAVLLGGAFYGLGAEWVTSLFGGAAGEVMSLLGSGTRFESIARGMLDLRDLFYFVSLTGVFLSLNVLFLERLRWAGNPSNVTHRRWTLVTLLFAANFLAANLWLASFDSARVDVTEGRIYSISDSTRGYLSRLREPLLIRGYFSARTHPLLAPLAPRLRDLLQEYAIAGEGRVRLEFVDPREDSEVEREAGEKYGIRPVPFQFASKYEASVVNSYFDILVQYGDQHEVLGFQDFIEVKVESERDIEVELRNPEYDITRAIKKVLYAYQGAGRLFENIPSPVTFKGYVSPDEKLPRALTVLRKDLEELVADRAEASAGKLTVEFADPDGGDGGLGQKLSREFGLRPMTAGLFSSETFWFYMVLEGDGQMIQIPLPAELDRGSLERSFDAALKRFSRGFLKTVTLVTPPPQAPRGLGMPPARDKSYERLREQLSEEYSVRGADLSNGRVPPETDILLLLSPTGLDEKQLFAVDQFLMRGGTVVAATSPFDVGLQGLLAGKPHESGMEAWLEHHGISIGGTMVLDPRNAAFPVPVQRRIGGFVVRETQLVNYPYFIDIRDDGMGDESVLTAGIEQVTMPWASPITIDGEKAAARNVTRILESSPGSWTSPSLGVQPDFDSRAGGFEPGEEKAAHLVAAAVSGSFESFFAGRPSPLAQEGQEEGDESAAENGGGGEEKPPPISRVIDRSPESARIVVFASNVFFSDISLDLASAGMGTRYLFPLELMKNTVDWSLEDRGLLAIRGRAHYSRTLPPLGRESQIFYEYLNYGLALAGLFAVWLAQRLAAARAREQWPAAAGPGRA